jgi:hypothetical protein
MKNVPSLAAVNAFRASQGLETFDHVPGVMRPGKTAKSAKGRQAANKAARANECRELKAKRTSGKK